MRWGVWLILLLGSFSGLAQIDVTGAFEKDTVVIGDEVSFTLSVEIENTLEVLGVTSYFLDSIYGSLQSIKAQQDTSQPLIPVLADFEVTNDNNWKDEDNNGLFTEEELNWNISEIGTQRLLESTFTIRVWDPGVTVVPYPVIVYRDGAVQDQFVKEGQMSVFVAPPGGLPASLDSLDVAPIKNIQEEPVRLSDYMFYFIFIAIAIVAGVFYWWYSKYKREKEVQMMNRPKQEVYIPAHEKAYSKLSVLKSKELWQRGEVKKYQSELTHIIREYLEGRYNIAALESTTDEIVAKFMKELADKQEVVSLRRILQVADLVKFAKARPEENVHEAFMDEAVAFVDRTKEVLEIDSEAND